MESWKDRRNKSRGLATAETRVHSTRGTGESESVDTAVIATPTSASWRSHGCNLNDQQKQ